MTYFLFNSCNLVVKAEPATRALVMSFFKCLYSPDCYVGQYDKVALIVGEGLNPVYSYTVEGDVDCHQQRWVETVFRLLKTAFELAAQLPAYALMLGDNFFKHLCEAGCSVRAMKKVPPVVEERKALCVTPLLSTAAVDGLAHPLYCSSSLVRALESGASEVCPNTLRTLLQWSGCREDSFSHARAFCSPPTELVVGSDYSSPKVENAGVRLVRLINQDDVGKIYVEAVASGDGVVGVKILRSGDTPTCGHVIVVPNCIIAPTEIIHWSKFEAFWCCDHCDTLYLTADDRAARKGLRCSDPLTCDRVEAGIG